MKGCTSGCDGYAPDTVCIGGGTPTALPRRELLRLLFAVRRTFRLTKGCEFTVEANPATVTLPTLIFMRLLGVNRLSFGLQSADNAELRMLSRAHAREGYEESVRLARRSGFKNINVDIMFGLPGQTWEKLRRTIEYAASLGPEHISLYDLRVEPNTPFGKLQSAGQLSLPSEEAEADMYLAAVGLLAARGFAQYEISNFARRGYMCRHNLKYWNCDEYLGFGPAAHSFFGGSRFSFVPDVNTYIRGTLPMDSRVRITASCDEVGERQRMGEYVMLRLRLTAGIEEREFRRRFGAEFYEMYGKKLEKYLRGGFVTSSGGRWALTPRGFFVSNYILSDILEFADLGELGFDGSH
ncbi:MAG: radical SAM family heme chaperone HemW, partial [Clostridia bacterium]|nr:radical SAM family heme chaperone HemW [Clostridia bacterium]